MKVLTTPVIVAIQTAFYGAKFLLSEKMSILVICVGGTRAYDTRLGAAEAAEEEVLITPLSPSSSMAMNATQWPSRP